MREGVLAGFEALHLDRDLQHAHERRGFYREVMKYCFLFDEVESPRKPSKAPLFYLALVFLPLLSPSLFPLL